eukprot:TRINITY_DN228_c0_g1_i1.p1 TRINITY_DN228_c0_g1~~TRINITY_DN228_c0_g1_i1.p1  ORF type:complete len:808 (+),score=198.03 TRINITY_DN228_c0_g1_i1:80-2503(+)
MKGLVIVVLCLALICTVSAMRVPGEVDTHQTLADFLKGNYSLFAQALEAKLPNVWKEIVNAPPTNQAGEFTIFAPTNDAINHSAPITQTEVLEYHIVRGDLVQQNLDHPWTTVFTLYNATGLNNHSQVLTVAVDNATHPYRINGQHRIVNPDLVCTNGVVQGIDGILSFPEVGVADIVADTKHYNFGTLNALLKRVNKTLATYTDITILAPNDAAFVSLFNQQPLLKNYLSNVNTPNSYKLLDSILNGHLVEQAFYPTDLKNGSNVFNTVSKEQVNVTRNPATGVVSVRGANGAIEANLVQPNLIAANGVVHGIDAILGASAVGLDLRQTLESANATTFLAAINTTTLGYLLLEEEAHTFFVPTNEALNGHALNVSNILYHVANQTDFAFTSTFVPSLLRLTSLSNHSQQLIGTTHRNGNATSYQVNGITVAGPFRTLKNTYVYLINDVIPLPGSFATALKANNFSDLLGLLGQKQINTKGLYDINAPSTTVFAPTTEAFNKLPPGVTGYLTLDNTESAAIAQSVLNNHIIPDNAIYRFAPDASTYRTAHNVTINVNRNVKGQVTINRDINVNTASPLLTQNGIAYGIDGVIVPPGLEFSTVNILNGLPAENHDAYGNYSTFIRHARSIPSIWEYLNGNNNYTIFPPTNAAFASATESFEDFPNATAAQIERLTAILNNHIVYGSNVVPETNSTIVHPGHSANATLELLTHNGNTYEVILKGVNSTNADTANVVVNTYSTRGQRIYGINRVLGVGVQSSKSHGLSTLEWILIGVGGAVLGLIILLIVAGAAYYLLVRPGRDGYRQIN